MSKRESDPACRVPLIFWGNNNSQNKTEAETAFDKLTEKLLKRQKECLRKEFPLLSEGSEYQREVRVAVLFDSFHQSEFPVEIAQYGLGFYVDVRIRLVPDIVLGA